MVSAVILLRCGSESILFLHWLYTGRVSTVEPLKHPRQSEMSIPQSSTQSRSPRSKLNDSASKRSRIDHIYADLVGLYILAYLRDVRKLRNTIMIVLIDQRERRQPLLSENHDLIQQTFKWTTPTAKFCLYIDEEAARCWTSKRSAPSPPELDGLQDLPS